MLSSKKAKEKEAEFAKKTSERFYLAKERVLMCKHPKRVIQLYDETKDEVMCLECGLIKLVDKGIGTRYTPKADVPEIMKKSR